MFISLKGASNTPVFKKGYRVLKETMVRLAYYLLSRRFLKKNIISVVLQKATVSNTYL